MWQKQISIHRQPLICGWVAKAAASAGGPRLPFPWPHQPTLTGGFQGIHRLVQMSGFSTWIWACPADSSLMDYLEHLQSKATRWQPYPAPKPPQLSPFNTNAQRPYSRFLKDEWISSLSPREMPATLLRTDISAACIRGLILLVMTQLLMTIDGERNKDWLIDRELCILAELYFCHNGAVKRHKTAPAAQILQPIFRCVSKILFKVTLKHVWNTQIWLIFCLACFWCLNIMSKYPKKSRRHISLLPLIEKFGIQ